MLSNLTKVRVLYADTDAMGVVYHTNYIRWFEHGRNELMRQLGVAYTELERRRREKNQEERKVRFPTIFGSMARSKR